MAYRQLPGQADSPSREPERVQPVPEHYHGVNFPYRGTEQHGVAVPDDAHYNTRDFQYPEEKPDEYLPAEPEPDPILVKVVQEHAREIRDWRTVRVAVTSPPTALVGKNDSRRNTRIKNMDAANAIYIGSDNNVTSYTGYKISAGQEIPPMYTTEAIYATTGDGTTAEIAVLYEFVVEI